MNRYSMEHWQFMMFVKSKTRVFLFRIVVKWINFTRLMRPYDSYILRREFSNYFCDTTGNRKFYAILNWFKLRLFQTFWPTEDTRLYFPSIVKSIFIIHDFYIYYTIKFYFPLKELLISVKGMSIQNYLACERNNKIRNIWCRNIKIQRCLADFLSQLNHKTADLKSMRDKNLFYPVHYKSRFHLSFTLCKTIFLWD